METIIISYLQPLQGNYECEITPKTKQDPDECQISPKAKEGHDKCQITPKTKRYKTSTSKILSTNCQQIKTITKFAE